MIDDTTKHHLSRVRAATTNRMSRTDLAKWIQENTFINGKKFSFVDHEYQEQILLDPSPELVIRKSAQTGISEMSMRMALGLLMIMPGAFRIGYTFPSASFASGYAKTRLNPIIASSPALKAASSTSDIDTSDIKTFGPDKELYFKGAAVGNSAISTSLSMLYHDELSFSDPEIIGDYWSRLQHSEYKWRVVLSTPTFVHDAIDQAFTNSRRHWNLCKCEHCNHTFVPDYYKNVVIPGYSGELDQINKNNIHTTRYKEAKFLCPRCGKPTSLLPQYREWVCENPTENHVAAGYQVQPFDAPRIVTLPNLIDASTKYASKAKFKQFALGLPATDSESGFTEEEIDALGIEMMQSPFHSHVMGIDLGVYCHFGVGGVAADGTLVVVHYERVALKDFRVRYAALVAQYRISVKVSDIQPYSELIMSLSETDQRLFAARFVVRNGLEVYELKQQEADQENALEGIREVVVNRNGLFDKLLSLVRPADGEPAGLRIRKIGDWELLKSHMLAMRRAQAQLRHGEFSSFWTKPVDGQDHYFHVLGYLWIASQMRGIAFSGFGTLPTIRKFKVKSK